MFCDEQEQSSEELRSRVVVQHRVQKGRVRGSRKCPGKRGESLLLNTEWTQRSLYLCMWEAASRCRSPDTCSFRRPPWRSRQNTSTPPRPRTGTLPPAPPHWPRGGGGHRTPLYNSPDGTTHELLTTRLLSPLPKLVSVCCLQSLNGMKLTTAAFKEVEQSCLWAKRKAAKSTESSLTKRYMYSTAA